MATGFVGILSVELRFLGARSLKEKRMHLRSAKEHLARLAHASVAEVDHHDAWQRTRITLACVAREAGEAERLLDAAERWLAAQPYDVALPERATVTLEDIEGLAA